MIATRVMELRKRRGLMIALIVMNIGFPAVFLLIRLLAHVFAPYANPPAGGYRSSCLWPRASCPPSASSPPPRWAARRDRATSAKEDVRHLVVTGRSRLALYLARIPAGLAIVVRLVAIGYTILCAVCVFAAPAFIDDSNLNDPRACHAPASRTGPGTARRAGHLPSPLQRAHSGECRVPRPASLVEVSSRPPPARARRDGSSGCQDCQPELPRLHPNSPPPADFPHDPGRAVARAEATVGFTLGLGLASLMGQRTVPVVLLIVFQIILTPILSGISILQRSLVGLALAHLRPSGLALAATLPGVTGGVGRPGAAQALLPESATQAVFVVIGWLAVWTILGAWRMMTRDA